MSFLIVGSQSIDLDITVEAPEIHGIPNSLGGELQQRKSSVAAHRGLAAMHGLTLLYYVVLHKYPMHA